VNEIARTDRLRRNPRDRASLRQRTPPPRAAPAEKPVRRILDPAGFVLALVESEVSQPTPASLEALAAARRLADAAGRGVIALPLGEGLVDERLRGALAQAGVDRVAIATAALADAEAATAAIDSLWRSADLRELVCADTALAGDAARRAASAQGIRALANVARLEPDAIVCLEDGGRNERLRNPAPVLILAPGYIPPLSLDWIGEAHLMTVEASSSAVFGLRDLGRSRADGFAMPLEEAELILSAGQGVKDWEAFHRLAAALGAAEAGSRVVCDAGHLPRERQVGASGEIVAPRCYIALGLSGAVQHLQGIAECRRVVAVNIDPHAPILGRADLAIVGDANEIMRALLAAFAGAR
jgi:electron transfer flavoprotein alpha subunit